MIYEGIEVGSQIQVKVLENSNICKVIIYVVNSNLTQKLQRKKGDAMVKTSKSY